MNLFRGYCLLTRTQTYTVEFDRKGASTLGHVVGRLLENGQRFLANHADAWTLLQLGSSTADAIGRRGRVSPGDGGRNIFQMHRQGQI